jgi:hypothetical protein
MKIHLYILLTNSFNIIYYYYYRELTFHDLYEIIIYILIQQI